MLEIAFLRTVLRAYFNTALVYGFARAVTYDYKGSKKYYNDNTRTYENKEMLLVDKIGRVSTNTLAAVLAWPFMLGDDLARLECTIKGKDL